ncbi:YceI family protein [Pollutimonas harenae]|uniref:YceI family protein n=1 Tax=Pollutimonas harenae TaxID=657015 RepID=A0A853H7G3_9BURK|nr:YceI family protein [Pollutimonas harenae]NYT86024.1 YceI family protein [Pollutimonas harenae]TEA71072.1 YceI family protein [Pollutimonas harenae]
MNIPFLRAVALAAALGLGALGNASAAVYTALDTDASSVTFGYSQMNVSMDGSFGKIKATEFNFDPQNPEAAKVTIEIALASIDAGYEEANAELEKDEWLALGQHPLATFTSKKVEALTNGYQVIGDLSIKGKTKEVTVPFSFKEHGNTGVFEGSFTFHRADFGVGEGQWKDFSIVANDIAIKFNIVAKP